MSRAGSLDLHNKHTLEQIRLQEKQSVAESAGKNRGLKNDGCSIQI